MAGGPATDDAASFAAFAERHRAELVRAAGRIALDSAEAEDVVQDTLVALWRHWQRRRPNDPAAYAFRAVTLNAIKRRMRRRRAVPLEAAGDVAAAPPRPAEPLSPLELERAIARLPPAQQAVVRMRFYLGLSLAQIGRNLSISSNTAASRCRYALATLKKALSPRRQASEAGKEVEHGKQRGTAG
jgi:RNA polymerase sigma-70 factor (ECF subfamily)